VGLTRDRFKGGEKKQGVSPGTAPLLLTPAPLMGAGLGWGWGRRADLNASAVFLLPRQRLELALEGVHLGFQAVQAFGLGGRLGGLARGRPIGG
jgi:hypothetical protein